MHEVHRVVESAESKQGEPQYMDGVLDAPDAAWRAPLAPPGPEALPARVVKPIRCTTRRWRSCCKQRRASISLVQRHLRIGYNRAARLLEEMERAGMVSAMQANGNREILVPSREAAQ